MFDVTYKIYSIFAPLLIHSSRENNHYQRNNSFHCFLIQAYSSEKISELDILAGFGSNSSLSLNKMMKIQKTSKNNISNELTFFIFHFILTLFMIYGECMR